ncbi:hypothetical protein B0H14DRAFT_2708269 [Mycena olivaceomarginata]|nr:hypothetical protein B0H14DRAFT_2708269 [Mycena olivaceomarginata]
MWGAEAVWVGTRFVAAEEASVPKKRKELIPLRVRRTDYVDNWNNNHQAEIKELTGKGLLPHEVELQKHPEISVKTRPWLMGACRRSSTTSSPPRPLLTTWSSTPPPSCSAGQYVNPKAKL